MTERNFIGADPLTKWDRRFLTLAAHVAEWSKDPSTKVGAVIVRPDRTIAGVGYNGFPRGVADNDARYADRSQKYPMTVHAEMNAILSTKEPLNGFTIYVSPLSPCASCAGAIIQAGIRRVVANVGNGHPERWKENFELSLLMFREAGVDALLA